MKGKKGFPVPKEHKEQDMSNLSCANVKYAGEFSNPEDLKKSVDGLASYVKSHKMKY